MEQEMPLVAAQAAGKLHILPGREQICMKASLGVCFNAHRILQVIRKGNS